MLSARFINWYYHTVFGLPTYLIFSIFIFSVILGILLFFVDWRGPFLCTFIIKMCSCLFLNTLQLSSAFCCLYAEGFLEIKALWSVEHLRCFGFCPHFRKSSQKICILCNKSIHWDFKPYKILCTKWYDFSPFMNFQFSIVFLYTVLTFFSQIGCTSRCCLYTSVQKITWAEGIECITA
jgi:hypothetical protein